MWPQKKSKQQTKPGFGGTNPYENFEVMYRQESEIHRRWQHIEDIALSLKRRYEGTPYMLEYVDTLRSAEKVFVKGEIKHWSNERIREELVRSHIEEMSSIRKLDGDLAQKVYEEFKTVSSTAVQADEVTRALMYKYRDRPELVAFIGYLRDIFVAYAQSVEHGETGKAFKDRLVRVRMEIVAMNAHIDIAELRVVYEEFKQALAGG